MSKPPRTPQSELFPPLATFYSPTSPASIRDRAPISTSSAGAGTARISSPGSRTSPIATATVDPPLPALKQTASATAVSRDARPSLARNPSSFSSPRPPSAGTVVAHADIPPPLPPGRERAAAAAAAEAANGSARARGAIPLTLQTNMSHKQQQQPPPINTRDRDRGERDFDQIRSATSDESFARMLTRTTTATSMAQQVPPLPPPTPVGGASTSTSTTNGGTAFWQAGETANFVHQQLVDQANKRISTFDYLRKVHEGRVHWFNAYLFDRADLARMPSLDQRKIARRATNYLLLGLSLPVIIDLYSTSAVEFLRSLSALLSEFDSFQQLRSDSSSSASLARARLPNMFRRPGVRGRRSTSATDSVVSDSIYVGSGAGGGGPGGAASSANGGANVSSSVRNFAASESELLQGEEYSYLLTPALPFEPDYFETFATLCDVLIECYARFLSLITSPRDCNASVAELFTKADARVRKILVQGIAKEFEDTSRANIKTEIAGIGKTVLSGLM